ncbi:hypothetical protein CRYUN_Cryun39dG0041700 [Craigia yunnanensis]
MITPGIFKLMLLTLRKKCSQNVDFLLVLDLEWKVEILEFPVLVMDAKSLGVMDFFHRVWHDTTQPFKEVIQQFKASLTQHDLWEEKGGGCLARAAFVICGNWDLKTKVPQQCKVLRSSSPILYGMDQSKGIISKFVWV